MKKMRYGSLTFIYGCKLLPPKGYLAITLFGYVFTRMSKEKLVDYLGTERGWRLIRHETMHIRQADTFKHPRWFWFYLVYIWQFLKAWPFYMSWNQAYRTICFEAEAYDKENTDCYTSKWERYLMDIKTRINYAKQK